MKFQGSCSIYIPKIGWVKLKSHRPIEGKVKTVAIVKTTIGEYSAAILSTVESEKPLPGTEGKPIGIIDFAITSDDSKSANSHYLAKQKKNSKRNNKTYFTKKRF